MQSNFDRDRLDSVPELPPFFLDHQLEHLLRRDSRLTVRLCSTSRLLQQQFRSLLSSHPHLKQLLESRRNSIVQGALRQAKSLAAHSDPVLLTSLWVSACCLNYLDAAQEVFGSFSPFSAFPALVLTYTVSVLAKRRSPSYSKMLGLLMDFSLAYAGNISITTQVTSSHSLIAILMAGASTAHALILSFLVMSAWLQVAPWTKLNGWIQETQSIVMVLFYVQFALYSEGIPGLLKLSSACCRLFMLVHISWVYFLPKLSMNSLENDLVNENQDMNQEGVDA